jgi:hypothetical protein
MSIDTYHFFVIVLSGFTTVWSYRKFSHSRTPISDFEYLGFSTLWGTLILATYAQILKNNVEQMIKLLSNPLAAGLFLSLLGIIAGYLASRIKRSIF